MAAATPIGTSASISSAPALPREVHIPATDDYLLAATLYEGDGAGPAVILNPATGATRRFYARIATYLQSRGMTVVTYDYRGMGGSRPASIRDFQVQMRDWGQRDFEGVVRWTRRHCPDRALTLLAHSAGAWYMGFAASGDQITRAVTVCSTTADWRKWKARWWWLAFGVWYLMLPIATRVFGYLPGRLMTGADLPSGVAQEWARWARKPGCFLAHEEGIDRGGFSRMRIPILSFSFSDDLFAPKGGVDALHALYDNADVTRRHLRPREAGRRKVGHVGFFRSSEKDPLWQELGDFLLLG